ncbi:MAG: PAS domain S-box protein [Syntrophobacteraceae bacterium]|jgi:PAS domain S-box-containing protein|nr:PAS domain S-box protein [Syntrophobacteraceae bacterium]
MKQTTDCPGISEDRLQATGAQTRRGRGAGVSMLWILAVAVFLSLLFFRSEAAVLSSRNWPLAVLFILSGLLLGVLGCNRFMRKGRPEAVLNGSVRPNRTPEGVHAFAGPGAGGSADQRQGKVNGCIADILGSEKDFVHTLIETAQAIVLILGPSGKVRLVNRFFEEISGYRSSELQGKDWFDTVIPEAFREHVRGVFQEALGGSQAMECISPLTTRGGSVRQFSWRWKALRDSSTTVSAVLGMGMDLTERDGMEDALRKSEERYRAIVEDQTELISRFKPDGTLTFVNGAYCRYFGEEPEQLIGNKFWHHVPKHEQERLKSHITCMTRDNPVSTIEHPVKTPEGIRWQQWTDRAILDHEGRVVELQAVGRDITERKRVEQALASERSRLYSVLDSLPVFVFLHSADYTIRFANRCFVRNFGDGAGRRCYSVLQVRSEPCEECRSRAVLLDGRAQSWEWTADRNGRTFQMYSYPFTDMDETPLVLQLGIDITDQKRNETELRQSESRLRELSSRLLTAQEEERQRIATELHDGIGSSLTGITVFLQTILLRVEEGSPLVEPIRQLISVTENTIREARRIMSDLRPSMLDDLGVLKTLDWLCREFQQLHPDIHIEKAIRIGEEDIPDPLKIIIFRLVQEAFHNISKHSEAEYVTLTLDGAGDGIRLTVEDNGNGFPVQDVLGEESSMKGLGLTSMRERTELSGGRFTLRSTVGEGTAVQAEWAIAAPSDLKSA